MRQVRDTAASVLSDLLKQQPDTPAKVVFAWRIAAGPALARATRASWEPGGTLRLEPDSAAWHREVVRAQPIVAARLRELLGGDVVKKISIVKPGSRHA
jgi:hypothetical protein